MMVRLSKTLHMQALIAALCVFAWLTGSAHAESPVTDVKAYIGNESMGQAADDKTNGNYADKTFAPNGKENGQQGAFIFGNPSRAIANQGYYDFFSGAGDSGPGDQPNPVIPSNRFGGSNYPDMTNGSPQIPIERTPLHPMHAPAPQGHPRDATQAGLPPCCKDKLPCCQSNWPCCQKAEHHGYTPPGSPSNLPYSQNMQGKDNFLQKGQTDQNSQVNNQNQQGQTNASPSTSAVTSPPTTSPLPGPANTMSGLGSAAAASMQGMLQGTGNMSGPGGKMTSSGGFAASDLFNKMQQAASKGMPGAEKEQKKVDEAQIKSVEADNLAGIERTSAAIAISFVQGYMENFTTDGGNRWNQLRNSIFVPMAILLLLPGAVLAQMKATVSQGFSVLGEANPFDGIMRSIIAIFLIPATYLVVNYGIDVANALTKAVADGYSIIGGGDMFEKATGGHVRAFPIRLPEENIGLIPEDLDTIMFNYFGSGPFAQLEGKLLGIKYEDSASGLYVVPPDRAPEAVPWQVIMARLAYNTVNAGLAFAWAIMCCVQECYLYYLWFVGPVVAALWVYPNKMLRQALPNWVEGVITCCFWSFFWSITIMIMALVKGNDDTGTIMYTALNTLALLSVKAGFDSAMLVKEAGGEGKRIGERAAQVMAAAGAGKKKGKGGGPGPGPGPGPG